MRKQIFVILSLLLAASAWAQDTSPLDLAVEKYKTIGVATEQKLRANYEAKLWTIRNTSFSTPEKKKAAAIKAYEKYRRQSAENVALYREPMVDLMMEEVNRSGSANTRLEKSQGTQLFVEENGDIFIDPQTGEEKMINREHRGARGDTDLGGSTTRADRLKAVAERYGFEAQADIGKNITNPNYLDIKEIELTVNRQGVGSPQQRFEKPGSTAHEIQVGMAANAKETYVSVGMKDNQPGKKAVAVQDHMKKANAGRLMDAPKLLESVHEDVAQGFFKGTLKSIRDAELSDTDIKSAIERNGLNMSADEYKSGLDKLKQGYPPEAVGLTPENISSHKKVNDSLLTLAEEKTLFQTEVEINRTRQKIADMESRLNSPDAKLTFIERQKLHADIALAHEDIMDTKIRLRETRAYNDTRLGRKSPTLPDTPRRTAALPIDSMDAPGTKFANGAKKVGGVLMKGVGAAGAVVQYYSLANDLGGELMAGEYKKAASRFIEFAAEEAYEELNDKAQEAALSALYPGLGQAYMAGKASYGMTRMAMTITIPGTGGQTGDDITQTMFQSLMDGASGVNQKEAQNRIIGALVKAVKEGDKLAGGMKLSEAAELIRNNMAAGKYAMEGVRFEWEDKMAQDNAEPEVQRAVSEIAVILDTAHDQEKSSEIQKGIRFVDESAEQVAATKEKIRTEKERIAESEHQAILSGAEVAEAERVQAEQAARQSLAEGLTALGTGLQAVHEQNQALEKARKAEIKAHNAQVQKASQDYYNANLQQQQKHAEQYGDWETQGNPYTSAPTAVVPSNDNVTQPNLSQPLSPQSTTSVPAQGQPSAGPTRATMTTYTVTAKSDGQLQNSSGIALPAGSLVGTFEALTQSYGPYMHSVSMGGQRMYVHSAHVPTLNKAKALLQEGAVKVSGASEAVVLVDGQVIPAAMYSDTSSKIDAIRSKLRSQGINTSSGSWQ